MLYIDYMCRVLTPPESSVAGDTPYYSLFYIQRYCQDSVLWDSALRTHVCTLCGSRQQGKEDSILR